MAFHWDLHELPSAQHKAGLAGLALCVKFLERKSDRKGVCRIVDIDANRLTLEADAAGMQSLFDDIYDASLEEQQRDKKLQKKRADGSKEDIAPKRTVERVETDPKGRAKTKVSFIYDQVVPRGALIDEWDDVTGEQPKLWLKLWRDLVWSTLRGVPAQREPYEARADRRTLTDGEDVWRELTTKPAANVDLPSTYYLGAQARSAEMVPFRDTAQHRCLLHFWQFAVAVYVPVVLKRDKKKEWKEEFQGFVVSVPDIIDLAAFVEDWPTVSRERSREASRYRPRDAVIDVAAEGALDLARRAFSIVGRRQASTAAAPWLAAVDVFHVEKEGNNVRLRGIQRVDLVRERVDEYARVRGAYWSHVFRRQRIVNVLGGKAWWEGFGRTCSTTPEEHTFRSHQFRHDARVAFTEVEMKEAGPDSEKTLEQLVYQAVRTYVYGKLSSKYGLEWDGARAANAGWKKEYEEKKEKIARDAFLAVRSRTGADFVSYFTGTLCSVPQRLGEHGYTEIARALADKTQVERVRSLTLLALSATA